MISLPVRSCSSRPPSRPRQLRGKHSRAPGSRLRHHRRRRRLLAESPFQDGQTYTSPDQRRHCGSSREGCDRVRGVVFLLGSEFRQQERWAVRHLGGRLRRWRRHAGTAGRFHNFGRLTYDVLTSPAVALTLFWSDPLGASANDYDLYRLSSRRVNSSHRLDGRAGWHPGSIRSCQRWFARPTDRGDSSLPVSTGSSSWRPIETASSLTPRARPTGTLHDGTDSFGVAATPAQIRSLPGPFTPANKWRPSAPTVRATLLPATAAPRSRPGTSRPPVGSSAEARLHRS